jgi:hypothetical protein
MGLVPRPGYKMHHIAQQNLARLGRPFSHLVVSPLITVATPRRSNASSIKTDKKARQCTFINHTTVFKLLAKNIPAIYKCKGYYVLVRCDVALYFARCDFRCKVPTASPLDKLIICLSTILTVLRSRQASTPVKHSLSGQGVCSCKDLFIEGVGHGVAAWAYALHITKTMISPQESGVID